MGPVEFLAAFRREAAAMSAVLHGQDLARPVPACPGWDLAEIGRHLGATHRWAVAAIVTGTPNGEAKGPDAPAAVPDWYDESARELADVLTSTPADTPVWHFGPKPRHADFWFRRQALETAVHRWDAESACGPAAPIDSELAVDGIAEIAEVFFPRVLRRGGGPGPGLRLTMIPDDAPSTEVVFSTAGPEPATAAAVVRGPASPLYLLAWGRGTLDDPRFTIDGDRSVGERFLGAGLVP